MTLTECLNSTNLNQSGRDAYALVERLYPMFRSLTGAGFRQSLDVLKELIPLETHAIASGTAVFDWTVPDEWNLRTATIRNAAGDTVVDFKNHNLHVVGYSVPVRATLTLGDLLPHLHSLPQQPDLIPYRTSYYTSAWGFCLTHRQLESLRAQDGPFDVEIDATLAPGHLNWGECVLPGRLEEEVLISTHACHPQLANDNCSAVALSAMLARLLAPVERKYTYRFLFAPGTIGAIAWLSKNQANAKRIAHGLVCACVGDAGPTTYKRSRRGNATVDRAAECVLRDTGTPFRVEPFSPYGYDERQFCSPGFDLPVGCFMRTPPGKFPEYHTSADDLNLVRPDALGDSFGKLLRIVHVLETNETFVNQKPHCEPRLGKRGLYNATGGTSPVDTQMALLWVLNLSDGSHDLLDIATRSGLPYATIQHASNLLAATDLLAPSDMKTK